MQCLFSYLKLWLGLPLLAGLLLLAATANASASSAAYSGWLDRQSTATVATVPQQADWTKKMGAGTSLMSTFAFPGNTGPE